MHLPALYKMLCEYCNVTFHTNVKFRFQEKVIGHEDEKANTKLLIVVNYSM